AAGVDVIQLRDKHAEARQQLEAAEVLRAAAARHRALFAVNDRADLALDAAESRRAAAARHGALFAVNDRADLALAAGADVLHLGQDDLPPAWARRVAGADVLLGRSTHDRGQAAAAVAEPRGHVVAGPGCAGRAQHCAPA